MIRLLCGILSFINFTVYFKSFINQKMRKIQLVSCLFFILFSLFTPTQNLSREEHQKSCCGQYERAKKVEHQKSIKKFQTQSRHTVLREKRLETGKKASKIKASQTFIATPKPWVAGSNPPAPAKKSKPIGLDFFFPVFLGVFLSGTRSLS